MDRFAPLPRLRTAALKVFCSTLLLAAQATAHAPTGAIFTTTPNGETVNANIYEAKRDVYLDGGPGPNAPAHAAALDDGLYVFQVTEPRPFDLLSSDEAQCRIVKVEGGVLVARMDWDGSGSDPLADFDEHTSGNDACHRNKAQGPHNANVDVDQGAPNVVVQLVPYEDTTNPGGVYKAWVTPLEDYLLGCQMLGFAGTSGLEQVDCGTTPGNFHGFIPAHSKTDNFKVREKDKGRPPPQKISVHKFCDADCSGGAPDADEGCLDGVAITVTDTLGSVVCSGLTEGGFFDCDPPEEGTYTVTESLVNAQVCSTRVDGVAVLPAATSVDVAVVRSTTPIVVEFGNTPTDGEIEATKICGTSGAPIGGVQIDLVGTDVFGNVVVDGGVTGPDGKIAFGSLPAGSYTVSEVPPPNMIAISPEDCSVELEVVTGLDAGGFEQCNVEKASCEFQNVVVGNVGARTPGFWCTQTQREAGESGGTEAACYQRLLCEFGSIQNVANAANDLYQSLAPVDPDLFDLDGSGSVEPDEQQQVLCPQVGDAEHNQCRRQSFALLENVAGHVDCDEQGCVACAETSGCTRIGVTPEQALVLDGELGTVQELLERLAAEGCSDALHTLVQQVNENRNTVLPDCPALVGP